jgi:hypothetical protein
MDWHTRLRDARGRSSRQAFSCQKNTGYQKTDHRPRPLDAALSSIRTPETVMGKIQVQIASCDASKPSPPGFEDRPLAFGRAAVTPLFADVFLAVLYVPMLIDFVQKPVASPCVGIHMCRCPPDCPSLREKAPRRGGSSCLRSGEVRKRACPCLAQPRTPPAGGPRRTCPVRAPIIPT